LRVIKSCSPSISSRHAFPVIMEMSPQPELLAATRSAQVTGYVHTDLVTYCSVTYVTPLFFKKLSPSASFILVKRNRSKDLYEAFPIVVHLHPVRCILDFRPQNQRFLLHPRAQWIGMDLPNLQPRLSFFLVSSFWPSSYLQQDLQKYAYLSW